MTIVSDEGRLVVSRPRKSPRDFLRSYTIKVDGISRGKVKRGATVELTLPVGVHEVRATIDWAYSKQQDGAQRIVAGSRAPVVVYGLLLSITPIGLADAIARESYPMILVVIGSAVMLATFLFRAVRAGVFVHGNHIEGRSEEGTRKVEIANVERCEYRGWKGLGVVDWNGAWTPLLHLPSTQADEALQDLRRALDERRGPR